MKKHNASHAPIIGGCSLLVIFGILCLAVLALLSLRSALSEKQLSDASARSVTAWYQADLEAQRLYAGLRSGELPDGAVIDGVYCHFEIAVTQNQTLEVTLKEENGSWTIQKWQAVATPPEINHTLPVWQGSE